MVIQQSRLRTPRLSNGHHRRHTRAHNRSKRTTLGNNYHNVTLTLNNTQNHSVLHVMNGAEVTTARSSRYGRSNRGRRSANSGGHRLKERLQTSPV